jgi:signal transduction histidine kinase
MTVSRSRLARRYQASLQAYLQDKRRSDLSSAQALGITVQGAGVKTMELAKLHEDILLNKVFLQCADKARPALIRRAGAFFAMVMTPIEQAHRTSEDSTIHLRKFIEIISQRTIKLASTNLELIREIASRKAAEQALRKSERHYAQLLAESGALQNHLRRLSRQILSTQEEERKSISRELHDVIGQTLTGITIRLATLRKEAELNTAGLDRNIARTQLLVEKSVNIVHQFARELRPAVLDDLGLIPALHAFMKTFTTRTGVRSRFIASKGVEQMDFAHRTVLFRVAQEALTNVDRHAHATTVQVKIQKLSGSISMAIHDDGRSFDVKRILQVRGSMRLGLLGMRERLEMVGGRMAIDSAVGHGTTLTAVIPLGRGRSAGSARSSPLSPLSPLLSLSSHGHHS